MKSQHVAILSHLTPCKVCHDAWLVSGRAFWVRGLCKGSEARQKLVQHEQQHDPLKVSMGMACSSSQCPAGGGVAPRSALNSAGTQSSNLEQYLANKLCKLQGEPRGNTIYNPSMVTCHCPHSELTIKLVSLLLVHLSRMSKPL